MPYAAHKAGIALSLPDLALWAQHDNTGCQTGMLRQRDGSVLFWHTEEDTYGFFDHPRVVSFSILSDQWHAFMYSYLLPGPAFGWQADRFHALDSLHVRSRLDSGGGLTCVASWLIWRIGTHIAPHAILRSLSPYVDGCAINIIQRQDGVVGAETVEFGARYMARRRLTTTNGSRCFQVNVVHDRAGAFGACERLSPSQRRPYDSRLVRAHRTIDRLSRNDADLSPHDILRMLASRHGGAYAFANIDVKVHCVGRMSSCGLELYVQSGAANYDDKYQPRWRLSE